MYNNKVLKVFESGKNAGIIVGASGSGKNNPASCGDIIKIYIHVDGNKIADAKFKTFGCVAAIASSSTICDLAKGKTVEEALAIKSKDIVETLGGLPEPKIHCSEMAYEALQSAIKDFKKKSAKKSSK